MTRFPHWVLQQTWSFQCLHHRLVIDVQWPLHHENPEIPSQTLEFEYYIDNFILLLVYVCVYVCYRTLGPWTLSNGSSYETKFTYIYVTNWRLGVISQQKHCPPASSMTSLMRCGVPSYRAFPVTSLMRDSLSGRSCLFVYSTGLPGVRAALMGAGSSCMLIILPPGFNLD